MLGLPESVVLNNNQYKIQSPEGLVDFLGVNKITKDSYIHLKFTNGKELKCSEDHPISTSEGIVRAKNITKKLEIETIDGYCFATSKRHIKRKIDLYDIVNSGTQHLYYSNGIVSHNCEFLGSSATLISGAKLRALAFLPPIQSIEGLDVYEEPKANVSYVISVDCSEGVEQDYSTMQIVDVSTIPYRQVAKYRNNKITPLVFPNIIYSLGRKYNDAFVLVETNNVGQQVVDILHYDLEYENIYRTEAHSIKGQHISSGFRKGAGFGIKTTKSVKKIGCANLKALIENDKLLISDFDTISELNTFARDKDTYKAEEGNHDDLCMGLVLFAWLTAQSFFKEFTDTDIRQQLLDHNNTLIEESLSPVGIFDGNWEDEGEKFTDSDGDLWTEVSQRGYVSSNL